jgi:hypothetical protein
MIEKIVEATVPANEAKGTLAIGPAQITVQFAETLEEASQMYGEEAVLSNAFANWRVTLQSNIRGKLKAGFTPDQIQESLGSAKMGVATGGVKVDAQQAFIMKFKTATPEKQAEMLEMLRAAAQA